MWTLEARWILYGKASQIYEVFLRNLVPIFLPMRLQVLDDYLESVDIWKFFVDKIIQLNLYVQNSY